MLDKKVIKPVGSLLEVKGEEVLSCMVVPSNKRKTNYFWSHGLCGSACTAFTSSIPVKKNMWKLNNFETTIFKKNHEQ